MNTKHLFLLVGIIGVAALSFVLTSSEAQAFRSGFGAREGFGRRQGMVNYQAIEGACSTNDYSAWKALMSDRRITQYVTADNFGKYCDMRELRHSGKTAEADQLRSELGITWPRFGGRYGGCQR